MFSKLIKWSLGEYHSLPWRKNRTLYKTLVSEIMLQQTTVGTVLNHFERFIAQYPDYKSVALATEEQLTISWKGLGYYRRARNLKKACEKIHFEFNDKMPADFDSLVSIPGIGEYTASAIISIGHNKQEISIDANLERVLSRIFFIKESKGAKLQKKIRGLFKDKKIIAERDNYSPRELNEALMDLGRNFCKANGVFCELCPVSPNCIALEKNEMLSLPIKVEAKSKVSFNLTLLRVVCIHKNKILVYKKSKHEWLSGQYEVPTFIMESEDNKLEQYPSINGQELYCLDSFKSAITKYKITNYVINIDQIELGKLGVDPKNYIWIDYKDKNANLTTSTSKAIDLVN